MKKGITLIELLYYILGLALIILFVFWISSCNFIARKLGGTITQTINAKVVNATWKDSNLWVLYRNPKAGETPEVITFQEYSNLGVLQGKVIIKEDFVPVKAEKE